MNSTFKVDSEVTKNKHDDCTVYLVSVAGAPLSTSQGLFSRSKKMKIILMLIIFHFVPALVSGECKDHTPSGKSFCLRFEMSQLRSRGERLLHHQGGDLPSVQSILPEGLRQWLVSSSHQDANVFCIKQRKNSSIF